MEPDHLKLHKWATLGDLVNENGDENYPNLGNVFLNKSPWLFSKLGKHVLLNLQTGFL